VVSAATTRRLLEALVEALPDEGDDVLTGLRVHEGWGATVQMFIHTALAPTTPAWHDFAGRVTAGVGSTVPRRCQVRLVSDRGPGRRPDRAASSASSAPSAVGAFDPAPTDR
jgi:hypothetical protein